MVFRTEAEKRELVQKVKSLTKDGMTTGAAVKQVGIGIASFYAWGRGDIYRAKRDKNPAMKKLPKLRAKTEPVLLPLEHSAPQQVFVIYGKPEAVAATIARFM